MTQQNPFLGKKVLVVTAHPDDEVYFSGTFRQIVESGGEVQLVCATLGERGRSYLEVEHSPEALMRIRHEELRVAADKIGISKLTAGSFRDGALFENEQDFMQTVYKSVQEYGPEVLIGFGPDGYTGHRDHVAAHRVALAVARAVGVPYAAFTLPPEPYRSELQVMLQGKRKLGVYEDPGDVLEPTVVVQANPNQKMEVLQSHASQVLGLDPVAVFGERVGGHILEFEYFVYM
jgi:LmbE family N-acetylglucosaminyl deacetylase